MRFPFLYVLRVQTKARCIAADDVAAIVADVALAPPRGSTTVAQLVSNMTNPMFSRVARH
jgi:hypothetical protein